MSKVMLLYKNVTALSRDAHKALRLKAAEDFAFADTTHWIPVAGTEFYAASRHYPIVFVSEGEGKNEQTNPILLIGLELGKNDFVDTQKQWKPESYLPAFIRRYPFVLANTTEKSEEFTLCFDASFSGLSDKEKEGQPLFNDDGTNSPLLDEVLQFMNGFRLEMERTQKFVAQLKKLDLLEKRSAQIRGTDGGVFQVQDFLAVSEEKFAALKGSDLEALHKEGFLGWIFAHLMSLANLPVLLEQHRKVKEAEQGDASAGKKKEGKN